MALPPNSFLFLVRVRAVFHDSKVVKVVFSVAWVAIVAGAFIQPFCFEFARFSLTKHCALSGVRLPCSSDAIVLTVYDTLVLVAISTRLPVHSVADSWVGRFRMFFGGRGMFRLSRLLLQTGQQYFVYVFRTCD